MSRKNVHDIDAQIASITISVGANPVGASNFVNFVAYVDGVEVESDQAGTEVKRTGFHTRMDLTSGEVAMVQRIINNFLAANYR